MPAAVIIVTTLGRGVGWQVAVVDRLWWALNGVSRCGWRGLVTKRASQCRQSVLQTADAKQHLLLGAWERGGWTRRGIRGFALSTAASC